MKFGEDAEWYLKNHNRISAFQKYVSLIEKDVLPKCILQLTANAVEGALKKYDLEPEETDYPGFFWYLQSGYDEDTDIGGWLEVWIPEGIDWLTIGGQADDKVAALAFRLYGGNGPKSKTKMFADEANAAISKKVPKGIKRYGKDDGDKYYRAYVRRLDDIITMNSLADNEKVEEKLVEVIEEFTGSMLPGLIAISKAM